MDFFVGAHHFENKNICHIKVPTVKTVEIRQKNRQNCGVESPKLFDIMPVFTVKVSWFKNSSFLSAIAETLGK